MGKHPTALKQAASLDTQNYHTGGFQQTCNRKYKQTMLLKKMQDVDKKFNFTTGVQLQRTQVSLASYSGQFMQMTRLPDSLHCSVKTSCCVRSLNGFTGDLTVDSEIFGTDFGMHSRTTAPINPHCSVKTSCIGAVEVLGDFDLAAGPHV